MMSYIRKLQNIGSLEDQLTSFENRRIVLLNKVTLMAISICLVVVLIHLFLGNFAQVITVSSSILLVCIPTLLFQSFRKYKTARYWLLTGFFVIISVIFFHSVKLNLSTGTNYLLIILLPLIIVFLDGLFSRITTSIVVCCGGLYLYYLYQLEYETITKVFYGQQINWFVLCATVLFCVVFFKRSLLRANELIEKDRNQLDTANKTKNLLFAIISHDIRSPLSTLKQYLELDPSLRSDPEQFMNYQKGLVKKVDEINQTLDDLLFWSKSQLQGMKRNVSSFKASEVVESVMVLSEEVLQKKGILLSVNYNATSKAWCDKDQLTVAVRNLVQNAIKFTPSGQKLDISTSNEGDMIKVTIADTGKGMDEATLNSLKEGLIVESHLGTAGEVGTGLGLSLVSEMISNNNGKMDVKSELGVGTEISLLIPSTNEVQ